MRKMNPDCEWYKPLEAKRKILTPGKLDAPLPVQGSLCTHPENPHVRAGISSKMCNIYYSFCPYNPTKVEEDG